MTKRSISKLAITAFCLAFLLYMSSAYSADIDVEINTGAGYDSNVFRSVEPREDTHLIFAPKAALRMPYNKIYLSPSMRIVLEQHLNESDANIQELIFSGIGRVNLSDFVSIGLQDEFIISGRVRSAEALTDVTRPREFTQNKTSTAFKYELPIRANSSLEIALGYTNAIRDYRRASKDDWSAHTGQLQIGYPLGRALLGKVSAEATKKFYESDVDYISIPVSLSIERRLSTILNGSLSVGYEMRRYDEAHKERDRSSVVAALDLKGRFTPQSNSRLLLQRKIYDSDIATGYAFISNAIETSLVWALTNSTQLTFQGLFSRNIYIKMDRKDNVFGARIAGQYRFSKWGALTLAYGYERRNSSIPGGKYQQHTVDLYHIIFF